MEQNVKTLEDLAYAKVVQQMGTLSSKITEGKCYKMIEKDGINLLDLGKCIEIEYVSPSYFNDGTGHISFTFEKNNDNKLLRRSFYIGIYEVDNFMNVIEYHEKNNVV
jgi:hypothetical protein